MSTYSYIIFCLFLLISCNQEGQDLDEINAVLDNQVSSWNKGDLKVYMQGYWNDESLVFTGGKSISKGWKTTLDRYQKSYASKEEMGRLSFNDLNIELLSSESAYSTGEWRLIRISDTLEGRFTLIWRRINNKWCIIADHSS